MLPAISCFASVLSNLQLLQSSHTLFHNVLWALWWRCPIYDWSLHRCVFFALWPKNGYALTISHCTKQLPWWALGAALIYGHKCMYLESSFILCPFSWTIVVGHPQGPMSSAVHRLLIRFDRSRHVFAPIKSALVPIRIPKIGSGNLTSVLYKSSMNSYHRAVF